MKKSIVTLLPLFITCCFLSSDFEKIQKTKQLIEHGDHINHELKSESKINMKDKLEDQVTFEILEGTKEKCMCPVCWFWCGCRPKTKKCMMTWMKIKAKEIIDKDKQPIQSLKDKLRFSYSVSPIKYNDEYNKYVMPLILFESLDENIEVTSFKLNEHTNLDFNNKTVLGGIIQGIPKVEASSENGYANVYPYGIVNVSPTGGEELISAFAANYNNGNWKYMEAEITVNNKTTNTKETHTILLNSKLFNEFMKKVIEKYPGTTTANSKFRVPINN